MNSMELLEDKKKTVLVELKWNSIRSIMEFFSSEEKDLERPEYNQELYTALGWQNENHFDVISSFWTIFVCALVSYSHRIEKNGQLEEFWNEFCAKNIRTWRNRQIFGFGKNTALSYATAHQMCDIGKQTYARKVLDSGNLQSKVLDKFLRTSTYSEQLEQLASLCHSVANFMPCLPPPYNTAKGLAVNTYDFMPLFIDLIDEHCTEGRPVTFKVLDKKFIKVNIETLRGWKEWFISNRKRYCLEDYYDICMDEKNVKHIKGHPFFESQSLKHPLPLTDSEVKECLSNMIQRISKRASKLAKL